METVRKIFKTPKNHEIRLRIPDHIPENEPVEIIMIFKNSKKRSDEKVRQLEKALQDHRFLDDIREINDDFDEIDRENWPE